MAPHRRRLPRLPLAGRRDRRSSCSWLRSRARVRSPRTSPKRRRGRTSMRAGSRPRPTIWRARCANDALDLAAAILAAGVSPDALEGLPLAVAARLGHLEMLQMLLDAGADPNRSGPRGQTPLALAVIHRQDETIDLLLEAGANPDGGVAVEHATAALRHRRRDRRAAARGRRLGRCARRQRRDGAHERRDSRRLGVGRSPARAPRRRERYRQGRAPRAALCHRLSPRRDQGRLLAAGAAIRCPVTRSRAPATHRFSVATASRAGSSTRSSPIPECCS